MVYFFMIVKYFSGYLSTYIEFSGVMYLQLGCGCGQLF